MTNYHVNLTPQLVNFSTEGGQDSSILDGKSCQRTFNMFEIKNAGNRKMIDRVRDGGEYNDTTFQTCDGLETFESGFVFTANQILNAAGSYDETGFVGVGAIIEITEAQSNALNSYGYPSLIFSAVWADGSYNTSANLYIFAVNGDAPGGTFTDIAVIVPLDEGLYPYCSEPTTWVMPVTAMSFIDGFVEVPGFMKRTDPQPHILHQLFKQAMSQQDVDLEDKSPQEKADAIRVMLENLPDDHPLVVNIRNKEEI